MRTKLTQQQKIRPDLRLSPQMKQFVKLIQLPLLDLRMHIEAELEQNPLLEEIPQSEVEDRTVETKDPDEEFLANLYNSVYEQEYSITPRSNLEGEEQTYPVLKASKNWRDELIQQIRSTTTLEDPKIVEFIVYNLSDDGFLFLSEEEIAKELGCSLKAVKIGIETIQKVGPPGICARTIRECLLLQIQREEGPNSPTFQVVDQAFTDLIRRRYRKIARRLGLPHKQVLWVAERLKRYRTRPLIQHEVNPHQVIPEFEVKIFDDEIVIERTYQRFLPQIRLNQRYIEILKQSNDPQTKRFLKNYLQRAKELLHTINERHEKLERLIQYLVERQREFVESGHAYLKPLTMKEASKHIGLSESTVSRLANQKYVQLPWGCVQLREFFLNPLSYTSDTPRQVILEEIKHLLETHGKKISDQKIREELLKKGIQISRRTVNKYRHLISGG